MLFAALLCGAESQKWTQQRSEERTQALELQVKTSKDLNQPIDFTGTVLDQHTNPVAGASVKLEWSYMPLEKAYGTNLVSLADGSFSLRGVAGFSLNVEVSKDGYYSGPRSRGEYQFGKESPTGQSGPERLSGVFWLRKKGAGAELVTSRYGVKNDLAVQVPIDGKPIRVDLLNHRCADDGQIQLTNIKPPAAHWKSATEWSYGIAILDGGFIEESRSRAIPRPLNSLLSAESPIGRSG